MSGEKYWTYQSSFPTPSFEELPEGCFGGTEAQTIKQGAVMEVDSAARENVTIRNEVW